MPFGYEVLPLSTDEIFAATKLLFIPFELENHDTFPTIPPASVVPVPVTSTFPIKQQLLKLPPSEFFTPIRPPTKHLL